jgi:hypothetical protein
MPTARYVAARNDPAIVVPHGPCESSGGRFHFRKDGRSVRAEERKCDRGPPAVDHLRPRRNRRRISPSRETQASRGEADGTAVTRPSRVHLQFRRRPHLRPNEHTPLSGLGDHSRDPVSFRNVREDRRCSGAFCYPDPANPVQPRNTILMPRTPGGPVERPGTIGAPARPITEFPSVGRDITTGPRRRTPSCGSTRKRYTLPEQNCPPRALTGAAGPVSTILQTPRALRNARTGPHRTMLPGGVIPESARDPYLARPTATRWGALSEMSEREPVTR